MEFISAQSARGPELQDLPSPQFVQAPPAPQPRAPDTSNDEMIARMLQQGMSITDIPMARSGQTPAIPPAKPVPLIPVQTNPNTLAPLAPNNLAPMAPNNLAPPPPTNLAPLPPNNLAPPPPNAPKPATNEGAHVYQPPPMPPPTYLRNPAPPPEPPPGDQVGVLPCVFFVFSVCQLCLRIGDASGLYVR